VNGSAMTPTVTVVICTLGAHPRLPEAVAAVSAQTRADIEILVVDNAPDTGATARALEGLDDPRIRVVPEPGRGLSRARNRALACTRTDLILFTDDDALAAPTWVERLVEPFARPEVTAVTGAVLPGELRTPAQRLFEEYVGFGKGDTVVHWSRDVRDDLRGIGVPGQRSALFPWTTGRVGSGNNMGFRAARLRALGGFDEALGAGTATRGGEDLDAFSRVLLAGDVIVYTPFAVVRHFHREEMGQLEEQIWAQGAGMGAVLTKAVLRDPRLVTTLASRGGAVARRAFTTRGTASAGEPQGARDRRTHRRLLRSEVGGLAVAPWLYWRSRTAR
jgi:glycosyltransferase involved in cell wall biosynthesis